MVRFATLKLLPLAAAVFLIANSGQAAAQAHGDGAANGGHRSYSVRSGDTLDRIISQQIGASPFSIAFLRDALARLNPQALPQGARGTLMAGAVMQIPDACALRQMAFGDASGCAHGPAGGAADGRPAAMGPAERAELERRAWVRYP